MIGRTAEVSLVVTAADTAPAYGSGDVPVLATPRVLALAEEAAVAALADDLEPGLTSVGVHAELHHVKATKPGRRVTAKAEVTAVSGSAVEFACAVREGDETVAHGTHRRVIVSRERFA